MTDHLSSRERVILMGGACAKSYGWVPKKDQENEPGCICAAFEFKEQSI